MATGGDRNEVWMLSAMSRPKNSGSMPEVLEERQEDRHEDDDDLRPLERPAENEDDDLADDQERESATGRGLTTKSLITSSPPSAAKTAEKVKEPTNSQPTMAEVRAVRKTDSLSFSKVSER